MECTEYWLITTYFWTDGTTSETRQHLYTRCTNVCPPQTEIGTEGQGCNGTTQTSGGSGGGNPIEYEYDVVKNMDWIAFHQPNIASIYSHDVFKGKRKASHPDGGYFTDAFHGYSSCDTCPDGGKSPNKWVEDNSEVSQISSRVGVFVRGRLFYFGVQYNGEGSRTWSFQQAF